MTMPDNVRELVGFVEWAMESEQPINGEHIVALRDALQDAYRSPNSVGSGPAGGDDLNLLERKVPRYDFTVSDLVNEALRRVFDGELSAPGGRVGTLSDLTAHGLILSLKDVIERAAEEQGRSANRASQSPSGYEAEGGMNPDPSAGDQWQGAIAEIAAERARQVAQEGWSIEHDDQHSDGDMARAAGVYAIHAARSEKLRAAFPAQEDAPADWPWSDGWWKPKDPRRDLVRAAALIVAEIERIDRLPPSPVLDEVGK